MGVFSFLVVGDHKRTKCFGVNDCIDHFALDGETSRKKIPCVIHYDPLDMATWLDNIVCSFAFGCYPIRTLGLGVAPAIHDTYTLMVVVGVGGVFVVAAT